MKIKLTNHRFLFRKQLSLTIMRIFLLLFCTTLFSFTSEVSFSQQKVSIERDQLASVNTVFRIIKEQTEYSFIYSNTVFENSSKIPLEKGEITVGELLRNALSVNNLDFELHENHTIMIKKKEIESNQSVAQVVQELIISGTVTESETGGPLPGVSIVVEGTNSGVVTDFDGNFLIKASKGDVLVFKYVGMRTVRKTVEDSSVLKIALEAENNVLDEIVVVGYGTVKKQNLTASIAKNG